VFSYRAQSPPLPLISPSPCVSSPQPQPEVPLTSIVLKVKTAFPTLRSPPPESSASTRADWLWSVCPLSPSSCPQNPTMAHLTFYTSYPCHLSFLFSLYFALVQSSAISYPSTPASVLTSSASPFRLVPSPPAPSNWSPVSLAASAAPYPSACCSDAPSRSTSTTRQLVGSKIVSLMFWRQANY
jgi:hypothetical protein